MIEYPRISVITPSYNQGEFLKESILSVLGQSYPNLQYILIDGGSTDNSLDIIQNFSKEIDFWVSEPDSGQSDAINKGLKYASGEIVTWINSDDLLLPGALYAVAQVWLSDPSLDLLSAECIRIGPSNDFLFYHSVPRQLKWFAKRGLIYIDQPGTFWRRNIFEKQDLIDVNLRGLMDHDLWYRIVLAGGRTKSIKRATAAFRYHPESKTTNIQSIFQKEAVLLRNKYCATKGLVPLYATLMYRIWKLISGTYIRKLWLTYMPNRNIKIFLENIELDRKYDRTRRIAIDQ